MSQKEARSSRAGEAPVDQLFQALEQGDEDALHSLLPPLRERLLRLARKKVGRGQADEGADEVVQETLEVLWEKRDAVREPSHLLPFVFETLRHKVLNASFRARRDRARRGAEVEALADRANPAAAVPLLAAQGKELDGILDRAIRTCAADNPAWGRMLQLLREEKSLKEIQGELGGIPMSTLYTRLHRARKRLREILETEFQIDLSDWKRGA